MTSLDDSTHDETNKEYNDSEMVREYDENNENNTEDYQYGETNKSDSDKEHAHFASGTKTDAMMNPLDGRNVNIPGVALKVDNYSDAELIEEHELDEIIRKMNLFK